MPCGFPCSCPWLRGHGARAGHKSCAPFAHHASTEPSQHRTKQRSKPAQNGTRLNWITTQPIPDAFIKGALELEQTAQGTRIHRLPARARAQANKDPQLLMAESQPAGVRLSFQSHATEVELDTVRSRVAYSGAPARKDGIFELVVNGTVFGNAVTAGGNTTTIDMAGTTA